MTHKDFVLIAGALAAARADIRAKEAPAHDLLDGVDYAIDHMADALRSTNPRFDRDRFIAAARGTPLTGRDRVR